ncbi:rna recognition motif-containing protein [Cystoisospora suis]|uniref:Rna recognition motif-containing protein n=1 Tax=Cystoisospora suis TaxID=483139 RepID=A0A2C6L5V8_9APIC|nr:rna recognition motif-containing protein [Cystoisospora suis]
MPSKTLPVPATSACKLRYRLRPPSSCCQIIGRPDLERRVLRRTSISFNRRWAASETMRGFDCPNRCYSAAPVGLRAIVVSGSCKSQRWYTTEPIAFAHRKPARLRLRGLPFQATADDVARFFEGYDLAGPPGDAVKLAKCRNGQPSGDAYVYFRSESEARRAKAERERCYIGNR